MNDIRILFQSLEQELPEATFDLTEPTRSGQAGWLDVKCEGKWAVVEWRPGRGFGVSLLETAGQSSAKGLFEGPDEIFKEWQEAQDHLLSLLERAKVASWRRHAAAAHG
ncbi:MAG TPA: hypothetical protein VGM86_11055 [Thermoanaerobaculia bacterium]|jgi:hypothetical protein